jgi:alkylation response protein AidB-like acyl-CoA dehydrogenase
MDAMTDRLAETFAARADQHDWSGEFPAENYADLHEAGLLGLTVPEGLGGMPATLPEIVRSVADIARGDGATALVYAMHLMQTATLLMHSHPEMARRVARDILDRGALVNAAISEPATGSPSRGGLPTTTATRLDDGRWRIEGRKTFTTGSPALHYFMVSCAVNGERLSFIVHRSAGGLRIEETWESVGMRGTASHDVVLNGVVVPDEAKIVIPGTPPGLGLVVPAVYLGIAQAARDEAYGWARRRRPNSLPGGAESIAELPHIQEKAARIEIALRHARDLVFGLAEDHQTAPGSVHPSMFGAAKYVTTNNAVEIVDLAMRIVGAASLSLRSPLQRHYRDVRAGLHNPPMDDAALAALGRHALGVEQR